MTQHPDRPIDRWTGVDLRRALASKRWLIQSTLTGRRALLLESKYDYRVGDTVQLPGRHGTGVLSSVLGTVGPQHRLWLLKRSPLEVAFRHEHMIRREDD